MKSSLVWIVSVIGVHGGAAWAADNANVCGLTAQAALQACQNSARGDSQTAQGKCLNLTDPAERAACNTQSATNLKDSLRLCDAELAVRQGSCQRFGPAAYDPDLDPSDFTDRIDNPYFPLTPGTVLVYEGPTGAGFVHNEFFVTHKTVKILGVTAVEVHDTVLTDGQLTEDTLDWFAQDKKGNVWYFGENTMELIDGRPSTLEGTFTSGTNGAKPGIVMEAHPAIGDFYRQEFDLNNAEDFAEVVGLTDNVTVPAGKFMHCLRTRETTPLEPELKEAKWYALGVGNVLTRDLVSGENLPLVRIESR